MASQSEDGPHAVLSRKVIGAAMRVLNALRPGLDEKVYENALVVELEYAGEVVEQQRQFPVHYRGQLVGKLIPDLIVGESVIVDAKVVSGFSDAHISPMLGYLSITNLRLALLLNFKYPKLEFRRIVR